MADIKPTVRYCKAVDGSSIAWTIIGSGPPIVEVRFGGHFALSIGSPMVQKKLKEITVGHSVVFYDGRGTGLSDRDFTDISIESTVADLESVVLAAGLDRFALWSGADGSQAAIVYAARHPERVIRMVLYGGVARGFMHRPHSPEELAKRLAMMAAFDVGWNDSNPGFRLLNAAQLFPVATRDELDWSTRIGESLSGQQIVAYMRAVGSIEVSDDARKICCPTLVIHAKLDRRIPFDEGRRLAGLIPGARFVPVEGGNNAPMPSDPSYPEIARVIREFLAEDSTGTQTHAPAFADLTPRERDVLELIARGLDNLQIAAHLNISEKTVRNNITPIFDKLGVENRAQAIVKAREAGLGGAK